MTHGRVCVCSGTPGLAPGSDRPFTFPFPWSYCGHMRYLRVRQCTWKPKVASDASKCKSQTQQENKRPRELPSEGHVAVRGAPMTMLTPHLRGWDGFTVCHLSLLRYSLPECAAQPSPPSIQRNPEMLSAAVFALHYNYNAVMSRLSMNPGPFFFSPDSESRTRRVGTGCILMCPHVDSRPRAALGPH